MNPQIYGKGKAGADNKDALSLCHLGILQIMSECRSKTEPRLAAIPLFSVLLFISKFDFHVSQCFKVCDLLYRNNSKTGCIGRDGLVSLNDMKKTFFWNL